MVASFVLADRGSSLNVLNGMDVVLGNSELTSEMEIDVARLRLRLPPRPEGGGEMLCR